MTTPDRHIPTPAGWTTAGLLAAVRGRLLCGETGAIFNGIGIDSRRISPDEAFFAIRGERHDGHRFLDQVVAVGVRGLVVDQGMSTDLPLDRWQALGVAVVAVDDTTWALGRLARCRRGELEVKVAAITGSNGKTTTREMTAAVLRQGFTVLTPRGNFNNEIGLPLTLLRLTHRHHWAVVELGMNHSGEIDRLAHICQPNVGTITNIGPAHLEGLGSLEGVARAKAELLGHIQTPGTAVFNVDDPLVRRLAQSYGGDHLGYGTSLAATVRGVNPRQSSQGISFDLHIDGESVAVELKTPGEFMMVNALAAAAMGHLAGLSLSQIGTGLESFWPVAGRLNVLTLTGNIRVIDDTYNANPASMAAALQTLGALKGKARGVVVVGDMLELGHQSEKLHRELGDRIGRARVQRLAVTGARAEIVAAGARSAGMPAADIVPGSREDIISDLTRWLRPGDWVLVKGSRGMAMEKIVDGLKTWAQQASTLSNAGS